MFNHTSVVKAKNRNPAVRGSTEYYSWAISTGIIRVVGCQPHERIMITKAPVVLARGVRANVQFHF